MTVNVPKQAKVSLFGVSENALFLGRACALKDNPILGVYDPDPEKALRAALFLGISARSTLSNLLQEKPDILICSLPLPDCEYFGLIIDLSASESKQSNVCRAEATGGQNRDIPSQITSKLPPLEFDLRGNADTVQAARLFLSQLSDQVKV